jgi:hypothetical protein
MAGENSKIAGEFIITLVYSPRLPVGIFSNQKS